MDSATRIIVTPRSQDWPGCDRRSLRIAGDLMMVLQFIHCHCGSGNRTGQGITLAGDNECSTVLAPSAIPYFVPR